MNEDLIYAGAGAICAALLALALLADHRLDTIEQRVDNVEHLTTTTFESFTCERTVEVDGQPVSFCEPTP